MRKHTGNLKGNLIVTGVLHQKLYNFFFYFYTKLLASKAKMFRVEYLKKLNNDLEPIAFKKHPKLKMIKSFLLTMPKNIFVRMSGSGSAIVAYFHSKRDCGVAYRQFKRKFNSLWCIASKTI